MKENDGKETPITVRVHESDTERTAFDESTKSLLNLIADILTEIIVREANECDRISEDK